jgi:hypothetical protein
MSSWFTSLQTVLLLVHGIETLLKAGGLKVLSKIYIMRHLRVDRSTIVRREREGIKQYKFACCGWRLRTEPGDR